MGALRIGFAGTPDFAARHLQALLKQPEHSLVAVWTQPDRRAGRGKQPTPSPVKQVALEAKIPLLQPVKLDPDAQSAMAAQNLDLLVVVAYGLLLPQAVLDMPRLGCINVHASLLPRWRGAAPIQRCIEAGDKHSGICIMQMDAGLDTGPALKRSAFELTPRETAASLHDRLLQAGVPALLECVEELACGTAVAQPQPETGITYAHKISKADARIQWQLPALAIDRQIRAFNPVPVAHTQLDDLVIRIWQCELVPGPVDAEPGTILGADKEGIRVACGEGSIRIQRLQLPGKKALPAADLLRGQAATFAPGKRFNPA